MDMVAAGGYIFAKDAYCVTKIREAVWGTCKPNDVAEPAVGRETTRS